MSKPAKLVLNQERNDYRFSIEWMVWIEGEGWDSGSTLGDQNQTQADVDALLGTCRTADDFVAAEHEVCSRAAWDEALKLPADVWTRRDHVGLIFDRKADAQKVLKAAKAALAGLRAKAKAVLKGSPELAWPVWAHTAKAAGWKPPKGWKP